MSVHRLQERNFIAEIFQKIQFIDGINVQAQKQFPLYQIFAFGGRWQSVIQSRQDVVPRWIMVIFR